MTSIRNKLIKRDFNEKMIEILFEWRRGPNKSSKEKKVENIKNYWESEREREE